MQHDYAKQYARLYRQHWWWRSREKAVVQTIRRLTDLPDQSRILDVGCGDALSLPMLSSLSKQAEAWGIEIDKNTLIPGNPLHSRIYDRPLGDPLYEKMRFDLITALDVVEHIEDDQSVVDHMMQMLVPGGTLLITVPALPALWTQHDEMNKHFRRYTRQSLTELLAPHGELLDCRYLYTSLALPKLALAALQRIRPSKPSTPQVPFAPLNRLLTGYCKAEWQLARRLRMPFGSSLIAAVRKPAEAAQLAPQPIAAPENIAA
jgi:SAM-dependent methyltransferase